MTHRLSLVALGCLLAHPVAAQSAPRWTAHAHAVGLVTHARPALYGRAMTEGYLTQPTLGASFTTGRVRLQATVSLEGLTLARGELNVGIWGEGYADRRHPHTYVHEMVATVPVIGTNRTPVELGVTAGRGFVAFGTDDPMSRPFVKFPVNHHLSQVLERTVAIAAVRWHALLAEATLFNGDEPTAPDDLPSLDQFGDSWAGRLTWTPIRGAEFSASHAWVNSPEWPGGRGLDQQKWNAAARLERVLAGERVIYALAEWSRTRDYDDGRPGVAIGSSLVEAEWRAPRGALAARVERTVRWEEERLENPFRTPRPHIGDHAIGATRFTVVTGRASRSFRFGVSDVRPFVEAARIWASPLLAITFFEPEQFYGSRAMWSLSAGARVAVGTGTHGRMGRYGPAASLPDVPHRH